MSNVSIRTFGRAISALALTFAVSAPAAANHWHSHHGMPYGHPSCQGYHGMYHGLQGCPHMKSGAHPAALAGKALGVHVSNLPDARLDEAGLGYGVNVENVLPDSAADAAGIQAGDVIVEFAGKPVYSTERLRWLVRQAEAEKSLDIKLLREGTPVTVNATLKEAAPKEKCEPMRTPRVGT